MKNIKIYIFLIACFTASQPYGLVGQSFLESFLASPENLAVGLAVYGMTDALITGTSNLASPAMSALGSCISALSLAHGAESVKKTGYVATGSYDNSLNGRLKGVFKMLKSSGWFFCIFAGSVIGGKKLLGGLILKSGLLHRFRL